MNVPPGITFMQLTAFCYLQPQGTYYTWLYRPPFYPSSPAPLQGGNYNANFMQNYQFWFLLFKDPYGNLKTIMRNQYTQEYAKLSGQSDVKMTTSWGSLFELNTPGNLVYLQSATTGDKLCWNNGVVAMGNGICHFECFPFLSPQPGNSVVVAVGFPGGFYLVYINGNWIIISAKRRKRDVPATDLFKMNKYDYGMGFIQYNEMGSALQFEAVTLQHQGTGFYMQCGVNAYTGKATNLIFGPPIGPTRISNSHLYDQSIFIINYSRDGGVNLRCHVDQEKAVGLKEDRVILKDVSLGIDSIYLQPEMTGLAQP